MARAKTPARKARPAAPPEPQVGDAPLPELTRDQLSVFLYVALTPEETRAIVKDRKLGIPGFRTGSLSDVERCDVIADEIRADPDAARPVIEALTRAFGGPPLPAIPLGTGGARDLLTVGGGDSALALSLWRVLSDRDPVVRREAIPLLDELAVHYYGPAERPAQSPGRADAPEPGSADDPAAQVEALVGELEKAERRLRETEEAAQARAEEVRRKGEEQREKLQAALREARAQASRAVEEAARLREEAAQAQGDAARARSEAEALRATDAVSEAARFRSEARDLSGRVGALEARVERARERERELEAELERARSAQAAAPPAQAGAGPGTGEAQEAAEAETWLLPVYSREFYDSLEGWDRRIQRAAFKQAHQLALDHRHPSLRAIPLEGLPGYYRVRVATDVRLIYRRPERQNTVEILSLIDREDLDRYVRQAKTRA